MSEGDWLTLRFEENRQHLHAVAYRMLGSAGEAEDAVQEAWLRLHRSAAGEVDNLGGWLTTTVGRVCLDILRSRGSRREEPIDEGIVAAGEDPEQQALLADTVGTALLVVLDTLTPAERLAFVLHDLFAVPFEQIAQIVDRSPAATRQLASRARRRVRGAPEPAGNRERARAVVAAFLAASRGGDLGALLRLLDPDVVLRADAIAVRAGANATLHGAEAIAGAFVSRANAARLALIDGRPGAAWVVHGRTRVLFGFTVRDGLITGIELIAERDRLDAFDLEILE